MYTAHTTLTVCFLNQNGEGVDPAILTSILLAHFEDVLQPLQSDDHYSGVLHSQHVTQRLDAANAD